MVQARANNNPQPKALGRTNVVSRMVGMLLIIRPIRGIVMNVVPNSGEFRLVADDPLVIVMLPQPAGERRPIVIRNAMGIFDGGQ